MRPGGSATGEMRVRAEAGTTAAAAVLLALLVAACGGEATDPMSAGGGSSYDLRPLGPPLLVGALGSGKPDRLGVIAAPLPGSGAALQGVELRFRVVEGSGRLLDDVAFTDDGGEAAVRFAPPAEPGATRVRAWVAADPAAATVIEVQARPVVPLEAELPGTVLALPGSSAGVLLRVPAGTTYDLVPYGTSATRGRLDYEFVQGPEIQAPDDARPSRAPFLQAARSPAGPASPLAPAAGTRPTPAGSQIPPTHDVHNCHLPVHRAAPLAATGSLIALYIDALEAPEPALSAEIVRVFDQTIAPTTIRLFGPPLDLDGNGRLVAVMSHAMPPGGGVYCNTIHTFGQEVVYTAWGPELPDLLALLAHEFQHVINASQHYRGSHTGATGDVTWLNEGFSHVAEWKAGYPGADLSRTQAFLGRLNGSLPLLGLSYDPQYFAGWFLFALYLGDRFGEPVYRDLSESGLVGRANVERVTGVPFRDLLRDWFVTLALEGDALPDESAPDPARRYVSIDLDGEEERAAACDCLPGERLPGLDFEELPYDLAFRLPRTLDVQDADFFRFSAGDEPRTLYFHAGGDPDVELFALRRR